MPYIGDGWWRADPADLARWRKALPPGEADPIPEMFRHPSRRFWPLEHGLGEAGFERGLWRAALK
jgi:hypothetical protein